MKIISTCIFLFFSTALIAQIVPQKLNLYDTGSSTPEQFIEFNDLIFFISVDGQGRELRKSDGSVAGTQIVKDLNTTGSSYPRNLILFNNELYFTIGNSVHSDELWKTDGTEAGTVLVKDVNASGSSKITKSIVFNNELYFDAWDGTNGIELWKTDGTEAGTVLVKDINPTSVSVGGDSSLPDNFTIFNNTLFFTANDGVNGIELWKTDGTTAGTVMVKDIFTGDNSGTPNSSSPSNLIVFNNKLFFTAENDLNGTELWKTDGTEMGTVIEKDINSGSASSSPGSLTIFNNELYFSANDGINGIEIWASSGNGIDTETRLIANISGGSSIPSNFKVLNNELFFRATNGFNGFELWKVDIHSSATLVKDIRTGSSSSNPSNLTVFNNFLYFVADSSAEGIELWKTDGTEAGTEIVLDIRPGGQDSDPSSLTVFKNALYFSAKDGSNDTELYRHSYENIFTASTNSLWSVASNWENNTIPNSTSNVLISNGTFPFIDSDDVVINGLEIQGSATLNLIASKEITVEGRFTNNGTLNLLSDNSSSASLIVKGEASGEITYKRFISTDWHLIASPFIGESIQDIIANTSLATGTNSNVGLAPYNNSYSGATGWEYVSASSTGTLESGQGFSIKKSDMAGATVDFTGTYKTDDLINYSIPSGTQNSWNLIGNPYPSFIAANSLANATDNFLSANTAQLDDSFLAIYFWNPSTGRYEVINQASTSFNYISPGQGFFVHAKAGGGTISITEAMQSHQSGDLFFRDQSNASNIPEISLLVSNGSTIKKTEVKYIESATSGLDPGFDAGLFSGVSNQFAIYTHLVTDSQGINFMLQALPNDDFESMIIPVGVNANAGQEIVFIVEHSNIPSDINIFLEDTILGSFTQLDLDNAAYNVTLTEDSNGIGRFFLHTTSQALSISEEEIERVNIYKTSNENLRITGLIQGNGASIKVYDILGKLIYKKSFTATTSNDIKVPEISKGLYIVSLQTTFGSISKKILLE